MSTGCRMLTCFNGHFFQDWYRKIAAHLTDRLLATESFGSWGVWTSEKRKENRRRKETTHVSNKRLKRSQRDWFDIPAFAPNFADFFGRTTVTWGNFSSRGRFQTAPDFPSQLPWRIRRWEKSLHKANQISDTRQWFRFYKAFKIWWSKRSVVLQRWPREVAQWRGQRERASSFHTIHPRSNIRSRSEVEAITLVWLHKAKTCSSRR